MPSAEQLEVFNDIVTSALDDLNLSSLNDSDISINIKTCRDSFDDLAMAAEIVDLQTLGEICKAYSNSFFDQQDDHLTLSLQKTRELNAWSKNLISYIRSPQNPEFAINLTTIFPKETKEHFLKSLIEEDLATPFSQPLEIRIKSNNTEETEDTKHVIDIPLSTPSNDPIYLFISELSEMEKKLDDCLANVLTTQIGEANKHREKYLHFIVRIRDTAEILGINGLTHICQFVENNMRKIDLNSESLKPSYFQLFNPIPSLIIKLLSDMGDTENILDIVTLFEQEDWPESNNETESHKLIILLSDSETLHWDENIEEDKKISATKEDISLALSKDIHPDLFSAFFHDAPNQASSLSVCIPLFIENSCTKNTIEVIETAQRLTHAIKGSANIVEFFGIANMAHYLEEALESLRLTGKPPTRQLVDLLQQSADCIESMIDYLMGKDIEPSNAQLLLQQLLDAVNDFSKYENNADKHDEIEEAEPSIISSTIQQFNDEPSLPTITTDTSTTSEKTQGNFIQVPTHAIESLFEMVEEITISLIQTREQVKTMMDNANNQSVQDEKIQEHRFELEKIVDIKALSSSKKRNITKIGPSKSGFDSLELDQYSEIHGTVHSFIETVIDSRELNIDMREQILHLDHLFAKHMRLNKDLQYLTKSTKMVSVTSISSRLQRCMRHAARITQKNVTLTIIDNSLSIDEEVLSQLTDPLMHIIRNAIDHGIESSTRRKGLGKPKSGNISITFSQSGNHIHIQCKDDGQGINPASIYASALKKGLISEDPTLDKAPDQKADQKIDQKKCIELLLTSGFSTKDSANQISGRGVGLDAVNANIKTLNGKIDIDSEFNIGTSINVTVPLSHLSTHAIIISLNYERYAVPSHSLRQLLAPHSGEVVNVGLEIGYKHNDITYPLITIADLLLGKDNLNKQHITVDNLPIILLDVNHTTYALAVDSIQSNQEIIIKPMGNYINKTHGVNGVAIIADGTLISVLDIAELIEITPSVITNNDDSDNCYDNISNNQTFSLQKQTPDKPTVMIVDDSLSVRRSLEQLINDMGYDTLIAQDGIHAVELCKQKTPDIILSDMEMPRMNGLELTSYIKKSIALKHIPIVMITSRSTQKHRQLATQCGVDHYLTKPYTESQLLDLVGNLTSQKNTSH